MVEGGGDWAGWGGWCDCVSGRMKGRAGRVGAWAAEERIRGEGLNEGGGVIGIGCVDSRGF